MAERHRNVHALEEVVAPGSFDHASPGSRVTSRRAGKCTEEAPTGEVVAQGLPGIGYPYNCTVMWVAKRNRTAEPESQGQNLALSVVYVPYSLDCGAGKECVPQKPR